MVFIVLTRNRSRFIVLSLSFTISVLSLVQVRLAIQKRKKGFGVTVYNAVI